MYDEEVGRMQAESDAAYQDQLIAEALAELKQLIARRVKQAFDADANGDVEGMRSALCTIADLVGADYA